MRYDGIIFDLDGTLGDTLPLCIAVFHAALEPLVGHPLTDEEIFAKFGPTEEGVVAVFAPDRVQEGMVAFLEHYEALHRCCPEPFHGVRDMLAMLRANGVRLGMVTAKGPETTAITLRRFSLEFADVETGSPNGHHKADGIRKMVERWGMPRNRVLYVGDSVNDVRAAHEAGIPVAAAAWASTADLPALQKAGPDALFTELDAFAAWLSGDDCPAQLAQRVQALAQTGLAYTKDRYDRERYEALLGIAAQLMSPDGPSLLEAFKGEVGYATPKVDVRAIVLRGGRVLLTREADDGGWSLPGGWADVGDRPSEAVEREVREETGLEVKATRLLGVWDRNLHGHPAYPFHVYKLILLCEEIGGELQTSEDSLELGFFAPDDLPSLSLTRVVPEEIQASVRAALSPDAPAYFD